jgi:hypothetical protein
MESICFEPELDPFDQYFGTTSNFGFAYDEEDGCS